MTVVTIGYTANLKDSTGATPINSTAYGTYSAGGTVARVSGVIGVASCSNNLFDTDDYNTIAWSLVSGAERYYVYKKSNGLYGYIGQTQGNNFKDDNIAADISKTPPFLDNPFFSANNYPTAVGYFEQRRCFGGSINNPARFWATRSATETNLSYSIPGRDDDAIVFTIASRDRQQIEHIIPMAQLILLTESGEWRVSPADGSVLTPDVSVRQQSSIGAADATPQIVNNNLIFAARHGGHMRELAYNYQVNGYLTGDVSLRATHLFDGFSIVDMAYMKAPIPIVWAVSSNGKLLGFTYVPDQEVGAWHAHDTQGGLFESIAVVPEGDNEDVLYAVVNRGGQRSIERMASRAVDNVAQGFFVDFGATQTFGSPVSTITSGLSHLEGMTVAVLTDGAVHPNRVVTGGAITLDQPATIVTVGLPIEADLKTLPLAFEVPGYGQGRPKNVNKVWLRVFKSSGVKIGPSFDKLTEHKQRTDEPYGVAPRLITDELGLAIGPSWSSDGGVCVRHDQPLPITVLSMTIDFAVGG